MMHTGKSSGKMEGPGRTFQETAEISGSAFIRSDRTYSALPRHDGRWISNSNKRVAPEYNLR
jgi:hypothetical protein